MNRPNCSREQFFKALADETRLRLLNLMAAGEICVCYLVEILGQPQSKISRHLAYLRQAGIVCARRDGKWMHYRIATQRNPGEARILRQILAWLGDEKTMQADIARLNGDCGTPAKISLHGPPLLILQGKSARKRKS